MLIFCGVIPEQWVGSEVTGSFTVILISFYIGPRSVTHCIHRRQCTPGDLHTIIIALLSMNEKTAIRSDLQISAWPLTALKLLTVSQSRL